MAEVTPTTPNAEEARRERRRELKAFLLVTVVLAPVIAIAVIGTYGLVVWLTHALGAPPGLPVD